MRRSLLGLAIILTTISCTEIVVKKFPLEQHCLDNACDEGYTCLHEVCITEQPRSLPVTIKLSPRGFYAYPIIPSIVKDDTIENDKPLTTISIGPPLKVLFGVNEGQKEIRARIAITPSDEKNKYLRNIGDIDNTALAKFKFIAPGTYKFDVYPQPDDKGYPYPSFTERDQYLPIGTQDFIINLKDEKKDRGNVALAKLSVANITTRLPAGSPDDFRRSYSLLTINSSAGEAEKEYRTLRYVLGSEGDIVIPFTYYNSDNETGKTPPCNANSHIFLDTARSKGDEHFSYSEKYKLRLTADGTSPNICHADIPGADKTQLPETVIVRGNISRDNLPLENGKARITFSGVVRCTSKNMEICTRNDLSGDAEQKTIFTASAVVDANGNYQIGIPRQDPALASSPLSDNLHYTVSVFANDSVKPVTYAKFNPTQSVFNVVLPSLKNVQIKITGKNNIPMPNPTIQITPFNINNDNLAVSYENATFYGMKVYANDKGALKTTLPEGDYLIDIQPPPIFDLPRTYFKLTVSDHGEAEFNINDSAVAYGEIELNGDLLSDKVPATFEKTHVVVYGCNGKIILGETYAKDIENTNGKKGRYTVIVSPEPPCDLF